MGKLTITIVLFCWIIRSLLSFPKETTQHQELLFNGNALPAYLTRFKVHLSGSAHKPQEEKSKLENNQSSNPHLWPGNLKEIISRRPETKRPNNDWHTLAESNSSMFEDERTKKLNGSILPSAVTDQGIRTHGIILLDNISRKNPKMPKLVRPVQLKVTNHMFTGSMLGHVYLHEIFDYLACERDLQVFIYLLEMYKFVKMLRHQKILNLETKYHLDKITKLLNRLNDCMKMYDIWPRSHIRQFMLHLHAQTVRNKLRRPSFHMKRRVFLLRMGSFLKAVPQRDKFGRGRVKHIPPDIIIIIEVPVICPLCGKICPQVERMTRPEASAAARFRHLQKTKPFGNVGNRLSAYDFFHDFQHDRVMKILSRMRNLAKKDLHAELWLLHKKRWWTKPICSYLNWRCLLGLKSLHQHSNRITRRLVKQRPTCLLGYRWVNLKKYAPHKSRSQVRINLALALLCKQGPHKRFCSNFHVILESLFKLFNYFERYSLLATKQILLHLKHAHYNMNLICQSCCDATKRGVIVAVEKLSNKKRGRLAVVHLAANLILVTRAQDTVLVYLTSQYQHSSGIYPQLWHYIRRLVQLPIRNRHLLLRPLDFEKSFVRSHERNFGKTTAITYNSAKANVHTTEHPLHGISSADIPFNNHEYTQSGKLQTRSNESFPSEGNRTPAERNSQYLQQMIKSILLYLKKNKNNVGKRKHRMLNSHVCLLYIFKREIPRDMKGEAEHKKPTNIQPAGFLLIQIKPFSDYILRSSVHTEDLSSVSQRCRVCLQLLHALHKMFKLQRLLLDVYSSVKYIAKREKREKDNKIGNTKYATLDHLMQRLLVKTPLQRLSRLKRESTLDNDFLMKIDLTSDLRKKWLKMKEDIKTLRENIDDNIESLTRIEADLGQAIVRGDMLAAVDVKITDNNKITNEMKIAGWRIVEMEFRNIQNEILKLKNQTANKERKALMTTAKKKLENVTKELDDEKSKINEMVDELESTDMISLTLADDDDDKDDSDNKVIDHSKAIDLINEDISRSLNTLSGSADAEVSDPELEFVDGLLKKVLSRNKRETSKNKLQEKSEISPIRVSQSKRSTVTQNKHFKKRTNDSLSLLHKLNNTANNIVSREISESKPSQWIFFDSLQYLFQKPKKDFGSSWTELRKKVLRLLTIVNQIKEKYFRIQTRSHELQEEEGNIELEIIDSIKSIANNTNKDSDFLNNKKWKLIGQKMTSYATELYKCLKEIEQNENNMILQNVNEKMVKILNLFGEKKVQLEANMESNSDPQALIEFSIGTISSPREGSSEPRVDKRLPDNGEVNMIHSDKVRNEINNSKSMLKKLYMLSLTTGKVKKNLKLEDAEAVLNHFLLKKQKEFSKRRQLQLVSRKKRAFRGRRRGGRNSKLYRRKNHRQRPTGYSSANEGNKTASDKKDASATNVTATPMPITPIPVTDSLDNEDLDSVLAALDQEKVRSSLVNQDSLDDQDLNKIFNENDEMTDRNKMDNSAYLDNYNSNIRDSRSEDEMQSIPEKDIYGSKVEGRLWKYSSKKDYDDYDLDLLDKYKLGLHDGPPQPSNEDIFNDNKYLTESVERKEVITNRNSGLKDKLFSSSKHVQKNYRTNDGSIVQTRKFPKKVLVPKDPIDMEDDLQEISKKSWVKNVKQTSDDTMGQGEYEPENADFVENKDVVSGQSVVKKREKIVSRTRMPANKIVETETREIERPLDLYDEILNSGANNNRRRVEKVVLEEMQNEDPTETQVKEVERTERVEGLVVK